MHINDEEFINLLNKNFHPDIVSSLGLAGMREKINSNKMVMEFKFVPKGITLLFDNTMTKIKYMQIVLVVIQCLFLGLVILNKEFLPLVLFPVMFINRSFCIGFRNRQKIMLTIPIVLLLIFFFLYQEFYLYQLIAFVVMAIRFIIHHIYDKAVTNSAIESESNFLNLFNYGIIKYIIDKETKTTHTYFPEANKQMLNRFQEKLRDR
jgi:hypothetical protein